MSAYRLSRMLPLNEINDIMKKKPTRNADIAISLYFLSLKRSIIKTPGNNFIEMAIARKVIPMIIFPLL
jgi:hypothetical protein